MKNVFLLWLFGVPGLGMGQVVDTAGVEREVDSLIQISGDLTEEGDYDNALDINAIAEALALGSLGRESAAYGSACFNHGKAAYYKGDLSEAENWYLEAKTIQEKVLGVEHPDYATSLNNLAILYSDIGQYEKSEILHLEAKAIRERVLGVDHPYYAGSLINLAALYNDMGQYEKSEQLYLEAKEIFEVRLKDRSHPFYVNCLINLAILYSDMGQYEKAEPLFIESHDNRKKVLGTSHPDYATSLNNLATFYWEMGNYEKSELLYLESKDIRKKTLGVEHPDYAMSLNNLAVLYQDMAQYEKVEPLYLESKAIQAKVLGIEHPDYATILNNLALFYKNMGFFEKAEPLYLESKSIRKKVLGVEHPDYAAVIGNLASLYSDMGQYEKAETLYLESKAIQEKVLGVEHPYYGTINDNLANLYSDMGQYEKAEALYIEAKSIREKSLGKEHPDYAGSLINLATLYKDMGNFEKAEDLFIEGNIIWRKTLGREHPHYAGNLFNLLVLYNNMGNYKKAEAIYEELALLNQSLLTKASQYLPEQELNSYVNSFSERQYAMLSFASLAPVQASFVAKLNFDNAIFRKGFLLNAVNQVKRLSLTDSTSTEKYNLLKSYHRRLAAQYTQPIVERDSTLVADLEEKANTLEKELVRTVAGYGEAIRQINWQEVQQELKRDEAAIEFIDFKYYDQKSNLTDSTLYAALLLLPGDTAPHFIQLCEQRQLVALIANPSKKENNLYLQDVYWPIENARSSLYSLLWAPLEPLLKDVKTVYYSPSGLLHRLNLGAVSADKRSNLSDTYRLVHLGSTRQLVSGNSNGSSSGSGAIVFGGIQYEMDSTAIAQNNRELSLDSTDIQGSGLFKYIERKDRTRGGEEEEWGYLPETEVEAENVGKTLRSSGIVPTIRKGYAATEESFKQIGKKSPSPRILHIATHGFFFPDPKDTLSGKRLALDREPAFKISEHPMIRSGLLLAGSNYAWQKGHPMTGMEDGILTAYEISQMNLSGTELVVLSACETGLGDIQGNEGVYGLQRAFKIAGVKNILMSLWKVPDTATRELMTVFYQKWLGEKMPVRDALAAAQQALLAQSKYRSPFYWAGFVLVE